jgi:glutamate synthase domain-containing protein 2
MLTLTLILIGLVVSVVVYDLVQRKHAILRNFPVIGHLRYLLESVGPELRQYIVTSNQEERPFSRDQRRWVYASSKLQNNYFGFGTDAELENAPNHIVIKHAAFPVRSPYPGERDFDPTYPLPCRKVLGEFRQRRKAFRPPSVVNVSGMSFGSLSGAAVEALNRGAALAGCLQNTGEGGLSPHHLHGGDLVFQMGTGYFGCRELDGRFSLARLMELTDRHPSIRAIEIKLSQGAKPGIGGVLPRAKLTAEIAAIRGVPLGKDCISPAGHTAFRDPDSLLDFVESVAAATGLPVGIKSAVGEIAFWRELARLMDTSGRGVDFVTIDGGEGGTGAAPLVFRDHVGLPFKIGFSRVQRVFADRRLHDHVVFIGSGKLGFPDSALVAFSLGCDMINVAREALLSIGCIQALKCHTNRCPTGITTQSPWLTHGLDPELKSVRMANYVLSLRKELLTLARACGATHPALVAPDRIEILNDRFGAQTVEQLLGGRGRGAETGEEHGDGIAAPIAEPLAPLVFRRNPRPTPVAFPPRTS